MLETRAGRIVERQVLDGDEILALDVLDLWMRLVEAPRGGDILAFRQSHGAAVRAGLIQPTTREDAAKVLVRREIALPLRLVSVGIDDAVARFHASADGAGAKLVAQSSFNVVVFVRKVWSVTWP